MKKLGVENMFDPPDEKCDVFIYQEDKPIHYTGCCFVEVYQTWNWYINDVYHREDGPALVEKDQGEWWYKKGKLHRVGGPAILVQGFLRDDGSRPIHHHYWLDGVRYSPEDYWNHIFNLKVKLDKIVEQVTT